MSKFFSTFPQVDYSLFLNGQTTSIVNIFRNVDVDDARVDDVVSYQIYEIRDGERPDVVSQRLYGTPEYDWTFFIINDSLKNGLHDWPLSQNQLDSHFTLNYDSLYVIEMKQWQGLRSHTVINPDVTIISSNITPPVLERENDLSGFSYLRHESTRVVRKAGGAYSIVDFKPEAGQVWLSGPDYTGDFGTFYLTTVSEDDQVISEWKQAYRLWVEKFRPGFAEYMWSDSVRDELGIFNRQPSNDPTRVEYCDTTVVIFGPEMAQNSTHYNFYRARHAPHHYEDSSGDWVTFYSATHGTTATAVSNLEYAEKINEARSKIRVVQPAYIREFAQKFRQLISS